MKKVNTIFKTRAEAGFTLVELMVVMAILGTITSIITAFLGSSLRLNELNVARSELRSNLTVAIELITTDLYSAGSVGVSADATSGIEGVVGTCNEFDVDAPDATPSKDRSAFKLDSDTTRLHEFTVRYCDPYTSPRRAVAVSYKLQQDSSNNNLWTLYRNERTVGTTGTFAPMVPGIVGFELEVECKPSDPVCDPPDSSFDYNNILAIKVKVAAQTTSKARDANQDKYLFALQGDLDTEGLDAEDGYLYDYSEQTVHPINLIRTIF